jgi:hypothetical protein
MAPEIVRPVVVPSWDSTPKGSTGVLAVMERRMSVKGRTMPGKGRMVSVKGRMVSVKGSMVSVKGLKGPVVEVDFFRL